MGNLPDIKKDYRPYEFLKNSGFSKVESVKIESKINMSKEQLFYYLQTISLWNLIGKKDKKRAKADLKNIVATFSESDTIKIPVCVNIVIAFK